jgi:hypothetical protein
MMENFKKKNSSLKGSPQPKRALSVCNNNDIGKFDKSSQNSREPSAKL